MKKRLKTCLLKDESWPLGIGMQILVSNHPRVLGNNVLVLSAMGKGCRSSQVHVTGLNESEQPVKHRD